MSNRKVDKRVLAESIGIGLAAGAGTVVGTQLVTGMIQTETYVPDILQAYESVDYLQHKVAFGEVSTGPPWPLYAAGAAAAIVLGAVYYGVRCKYRRQSEPRS
ncbi:hypothetical protein PA598K_06178 [Paenibacillus sp. 598K]|uniref:hypothetical protein n=1 Tax=Paenibacillus sp. 598K TaxID=1117987 RepID=UPI000FF973E3|nr:hypothetical protein PA598K_06178 [Paenibacillus sp. 598K]